MRWLRFVVRRLLQAVPVLIIVALGVFLLLALAPGDAVDAYLAGSGGGSADYAAGLRAAWGLADGWPARLALYLGHLVRFDLGWSVAFNQPVAALIGARIGNTLLLTLSALALSAGLGTLAGLAAALEVRSWRDGLINAVALVFNATPAFFVGLAGIILFSVKLAWLPSGGLFTIGAPLAGLAAVADVARHLVLPVAALALSYTALYVRVMRAAMLGVAASDHVRFLRANGLPEQRIVWRHMARNAIVPVVTLLGLQAGLLLGGSVVIETVFAIPGLGRLAYEAVMQRDLSLLAGIILTGTLVVIAANLLADLAHARLDPRVGASL